jgi:tetratricopeptide (TPR) repeat protein
LVVGRFLILLVLLLFTSCKEGVYAQQVGSFLDLTTDGPASYAKGNQLFQESKWLDASMYYWRAVLLQQQAYNAYTVQQAFSGFMECYIVQDKVADGHMFIARESMQKGQVEMSRNHLEQALLADPENIEALELKARFENPSVNSAEANVPIVIRSNEVYTL